MPPMKMRGDGRKAKNPKKTFLRLLSYLKPYRWRLLGMVVCIVLSTVAQVASNSSLSSLIEDYVKPMLGQTNPSFVPLIQFLCLMAVVGGLKSIGLFHWLTYQLLHRIRNGHALSVTLVLLPFFCSMFVPSQIKCLIKIKTPLAHCEGRSSNAVPPCFSRPLPGQDSLTDFHRLCG